jgi:hypothetical protein
MRTAFAILGGLLTLLGVLGFISVHRRLMAKGELRIGMQCLSSLLLIVGIPVLLWGIMGYLALKWYVG